MYYLDDLDEVASLMERILSLVGDKGLGGEA
jgi:hypothetical protein